MICVSCAVRVYRCQLTLLRLQGIAANGQFILLINSSEAANVFFSSATGTNRQQRNDIISIQMYHTPTEQKPKKKLATARTRSTSFISSCIILADCGRQSFLAFAVTHAPHSTKTVFCSERCKCCVRDQPFAHYLSFNKEEANKEQRTRFSERQAINDKLTDFISVCVFG